jgi:hypothetical protein
MTTMASKLWKDYGLWLVLMAIAVAYGFNVFYQYLSGKSLIGFELNSGMSEQYKANGGNGGNSGVMSSEPLGQNDVFASADGLKTSTPGMAGACSAPNVQNPADLLPTDANSQWAKLNPAGAGNLENVSLVKAGHHVGIDTVGQSLRNPNMQLRSEPPNPQLPTGPWNESTIESDLMRPPLTIGCGLQ